MHGDLTLTRQPWGNPDLMLGLPGTMLSPALFDRAAVNQNLDVELIGVDWMASAAPWNIAAFGERVCELIAQTNAGPVYLAGHSTGGLIALTAALQAPEQVRGLLLSNTGANVAGHGDYAATVQAIDREWGPNLHARFIQRCFYRPPDQALSSELLAYLQSVRKDTALAVLRSQGETDLAAELSAIDVPTFIAHGWHDRARPMAHAEQLAERIPHAELMLLDAGHTPMAEDPDGYQAAVHRLCMMVDR